MASLIGWLWVLWEDKVPGPSSFMRKGSSWEEGGGSWPLAQDSMGRAEVPLSWKAGQSLGPPRVDFTLHKHPRIPE